MKILLNCDVFHFTGRYFYYKDELGTDLEIGQYLSLEVELYDKFGETIYRDNGTFATPHADYCKLDVQGSECDCTDKCSECEQKIDVINATKFGLQ